MSAFKTKKRPKGFRLSARVLANRRNALKSTGPKSIEGKARSALNSLAHGLGAKDFGSDYKKVETLALLLIGSGDHPCQLGIARIAAAAELRLRFVRTLKHAVWIRIQESGLEPVFDSSLLGDPLLEDLLDPEARRLRLGDRPPTSEDFRMIARIRSFVVRLSRKNAPLSELRKLQRYERIAASERDRALAELAAVRGTDPPASDGLAGAWDDDVNAVETTDRTGRPGSGRSSALYRSPEVIQRGSEETMSEKRSQSDASR